MTTPISDERLVKACAVIELSGKDSVETAMSPMTDGRLAEVLDGVSSVSPLLGAELTVELARLRRDSARLDRLRTAMHRQAETLAAQRRGLPDIPKNTLKRERLQARITEVRRWVRAAASTAGGGR